MEFTYLFSLIGIVLLVCVKFSQYKFPMSGSNTQ